MDNPGNVGREQLRQRIEKVKSEMRKLRLEIEDFRKICQHTIVYETRWHWSRRVPDWNTIVQEPWRARICMDCGQIEEQGFELDMFQILTVEPAKQICKPDYQQYKAAMLPPEISPKNETTHD